MSTKSYTHADVASLANVPLEMREAKYWTCWRAKPKRDGVDKVPVDVKTLRNQTGEADDMPTWSFEDACACLLSHPERVDGIGFRFTKSNPFCGTDLDDVRDAASGELTPYAAEIAARFPTYAEASPSGTGVHIICRGKIPRSLPKTNGVELYDHGRFFTVTGNILPGSPRVVADCTEQVLHLFNELDGGSSNGNRGRKKTAAVEGKIPKGSQDNWLTSQAGVYRKRGDSAEIIEQKLQIDYRERCAPPHDNERRVREIARGIERYPAGTTDSVATLPLTDGGNADYVEARYPGRIKHQKEGDIWYVADENCRWREDKIGEVSRLIETAMREKYEATARIVDPKDKERHRHALNSCNAVKIAHCAQVLRARKEVAVPPGAFDADPWLLGVENGILDLRGEKEKLIKGDLSLLVAKRATVRYDPAASCPRWDGYLERVQPDPEMRACLAQIFGACTTGVQNEKCFIFSLGDGGNGKSTYQRVMSDVLGDYAFKCKKALIFLPDKSKGEQAAGANDVADLLGMRLISAAEQAGKHWNLEFIKDYTGGEKQYARQLYQRGSNFKPTGKIVIPANQEPGMDEFNEAIRRRFALLRWDVTLTPEEKQPFEPYVEWLLEENSGILNWALAGLAALKKNGMRLALPASAQESTQEYLDEQDEVSRFLRVTYEDAKTEELPVSEIYSRFKTTWLEEDHFVMSKNKFTRRLRNHFGKKRVRRGTGNRMMVSGLALRPEPLQERKPRQGGLDLEGSE